MQKQILFHDSSNVIWDIILTLVTPGQVTILNRSEYQVNADQYFFTLLLLLDIVVV